MKENRKEYIRNYMREYRKLKKFKIYREKYDRTISRKEYWKEYCSREDVKNRRKIYDQLPKNKERRRIYAKSKEGRTSQAKWKNSLEGKSYYKAYKMWWRKTLKGIKSNQKRRNFGNVNLKIVQRVYEDNIKMYGTLTCYLCSKPIPFGKDHLEHKTPLSRGGTNEYNNLGVACQKCNCKKHTKTVEEFRKYEDCYNASVS